MVKACVIVDSTSPITFVKSGDIIVLEHIMYKTSDSCCCVVLCSSTLLWG
jgi:hypothetical protein